MKKILLILSVLLIFNLSAFAIDSKNLSNILKGSINYSKSEPIKIIAFELNLKKVYDPITHKYTKDKGLAYSVYRTYTDKICNLYNISVSKYLSEPLIFDNSENSACYSLTVSDNNILAYPIHETRVKSITFNKNLTNGEMIQAGTFSDSYQYWGVKQVSINKIINILEP